MPVAIKGAERLFNLTCALLFTERGLTKREIFTCVQGYKELYKYGERNVSLEKLFERDKEELSKTGVHWQRFIPAELGEDNQETRYRIPAASFFWPKNLKLDSAQVALLNLAANVWAQASVSLDASQAIVRLRALGEFAESSALAGIAPRIRTHETSFAPLNTAINKKKRVSFDYRKPGDSNAETRIVEPWVLQNISGQWLLTGHDVNRDEPRNFLLRRIVSRVSETEQEFSPPSEFELAQAQDELQNLIDGQIATLKIKRDSEAWFRFDMDDRADTDVLEINFMDLHLLAEELREYAGQIEVVRPAELAKAIRAGFERVANGHHD